MKKLKLTIILTLFIAILVVMSIYFSQGKNNSTLEKKDFKSIEISLGEQVYTYNSYLYIYGKAGIKIIKDEKTVTQESFSLENPYVVTSYNKLAIGDKNGKVIRVYSNEGRIYTVNATNNILGFTVNKNGFLVIILKNDTNYEIEVYNNSGDKVYSIKGISYNEGVPVGISISEDNKVLAVSYIKATGATLDSNIVFYSVEDDKTFGGVTKQNQIVGMVKFVGNSNLACISDNEIFIIKCNATQTAEQVKEIYTKSLNNTLKDIAFLDGVGYVVCYGQPVIKNEDVIEENTVIFYNQSGGEIGKYYKKEQNITNISASKFGAILQEARLFTAVDVSGKKLWEYQATQDIKDVMFYDTDNKAIIVTNDEIKIVKIDKVLLDKQIDENNTKTEKKLEDNKDNDDNKPQETTKKDSENKVKGEKTTKDNKVETTTNNKDNTNITNKEKETKQE